MVLSFKVRNNGKIINKTVYLCVGLKQNGLKEVLGMWVGKTESSSFWMGVLTDLKAVKLILEWLELHRDELLDNWERSQSGRTLNKVEPLK